LDEFAACAFYNHDFARGYHACESLLKNEHVPESERGRIQQNLEVYKAQLIELQNQQQQFQQQQQQEQERQREILLKRREKQKVAKKKKRAKAKR